MCKDPALGRGVRPRIPRGEILSAVEASRYALQRVRGLERLEGRGRVRLTMRVHDVRRKGPEQPPQACEVEVHRDATREHYAEGHQLAAERGPAFRSAVAVLGLPLPREDDRDLPAGLGLDSRVQVLIDRLDRGVADDD